MILTLQTQWAGALTRAEVQTSAVIATLGDVQACSARAARFYEARR